MPRNPGKSAAELQAAGHVFKTKSDTETIAHGYEEWGLEGLLERIEGDYAATFTAKQQLVDRFLTARKSGDGAALSAAQDELRAVETRSRSLREAAKSVLKEIRPKVETKDADYVFITFVRDYFPVGLVGLLIAVIFCAAMSATASALNALGSTTVIDFYKRSFRPVASDHHYLRAGQAFTVLWGVLGVAFAAFASLLDNLIQAVNILGSIFYGPTLGVFLVGFFVRRVGGTPVFISLLLGQLLVILTFALTSIGFLWYNVIGCAAVVLLSLALSYVLPRPRLSAA